MAASQTVTMRPQQHLVARTVLIGLTISTSAWAQYTQQAKLSPTNGSGLDACVAISADGNTAIIGSPLSNSQKGTVSIYGRSGGTWVLQADKIAANDTAAFSKFGSAVALSADGVLAAVGSQGNGAGATYIFTRT